MDQKRQQEYYDELITGYLNQSLSREQEKELGHWVAADESHKRYYYEMTRVMVILHTTYIIRKKERTKPYSAVSPNRPDYKSLSSCSYGNNTHIAASLLIGVFLGSTGLYLFDRSDRQDDQAIVRTIEVPLVHAAVSSWKTELSYG